MPRPFARLIEKLPVRGRRAGKWIGGGVAVFVVANEVRGILVVAAVVGELWRNMAPGG
ncbi:MAG: hypothetical protein ACK4TG_06470 [Thermaurantiacus sp.]